MVEFGAFDCHTKFVSSVNTKAQSSVCNSSPGGVPFVPLVSTERPHGSNNVALVFVDKSK